MSEPSDPHESAAGRHDLAIEDAGQEGGRLEDVLREVVERLAAIERSPCSSGERQAAELRM